MENNIKPGLLITDPAYSADQPGNQLLAVDLSWDSLSFAIYDNDRSKFVALESFSFGTLQLPGQLVQKFAEIAGVSTLVKPAMRKVRVIWGGVQYTLIPDALYDEKHSQVYLNFTQMLQAGELVFTNHLKNLGAVNVNAMPSVIKETLNRFFPGHQLMHHLTILVESLLIANQNTEGNAKVFINVSAQNYDLIIIKDGRLLFCNSFEYKSAEDFLYYLLFSFEQIQLDPKLTPVTLIGKIVKPSAIHDLLLKYLCEVSFIRRSPAWEQSFVFNEVPEHFYYNILNILTCE